MALTATQTRFVPPLAVRMRMRCRFGRNLRLRDARHVRADTATLLGLTLPIDDREPLTGRRPVTAQILDMVVSVG
jgi:hypothetical protein